MCEWRLTFEFIRNQCVCFFLCFFVFFVFFVFLFGCLFDCKKKKKTAQPKGKFGAEKYAMFAKLASSGGNVPESIPRKKKDVRAQSQPPPDTPPTNVNAMQQTDLNTANTTDNIPTNNDNDNNNDKREFFFVCFFCLFFLCFFICLCKHGLHIGMDVCFVL